LHAIASNISGSVIPSRTLIEEPIVTFCISNRWHYNRGGDVKTNLYTLIRTKKNCFNKWPIVIWWYIFYGGDGHFPPCDVHIHHHWGDVKQIPTTCVDQPPWPSRFLVFRRLLSPAPPFPQRIASPNHDAAAPPPQELDMFPRRSDVAIR
jgi:hypothetical protein